MNPNSNNTNYNPEQSQGVEGQSQPQIDLNIPSVQPSIPTPQPPPSQPIPMSEPPIVHEVPHKTNGFVLILVIILILTSVGSFGYWAYQNYFAKQVENEQVQPEAVVPTAAPDPTADWKTYTNSKLNLSLKYPDVYSIVEKYSATRSAEPTLLVDANPYFNSKNLKLCQTNSTTSCLIPGKDWKENNDITETTLSGLKAISFIVSAKNSGNTFTKLFVIQTTQKPTIEIALSIDGLSGLETVHQIVSTVKITSNQTSTSVTPNSSPSANLNLTKEQAAAKVVALPEVQDYLSQTQNAKVVIDTEKSSDQVWVIHIYQNISGQISTFGYYSVNKSTGSVFNFTIK